MAVRNIRKQLAGVEDLLLGKGKQDQERSAGIVSITKIDIPAIVETIDELSLVDINKYTTAIVKDIDRGGTFIYDSTKVAESNNGTNFNGWIRQSDFITPEMFGAIGDGVTDDTQALQNMFDVGGNIKANNTYLYSKLSINVYFSLTGNALFKQDLSDAMPQIATIKINVGFNAENFRITSDGGNDLTLDFLECIGDDINIGYLELTATTERNRVGGSNFSGSNIRINRMYSKNVARPLAFVYLGEVTQRENIHIGDVEVDTFIRALKFNYASDFTVGSLTTKNRWSTATPNAGYNGLLIENSHDFSVGDCYLADSTEHSIRLGGNGDVYNFKFGNITTVNSGGCSFKANVDTGFWAYNGSIGSIVGINTGEGKTTGNSEVCRLSKVKRLNIVDVSAYVFCSRALLLADIEDLSIGSVYAENVSARVVELAGASDASNGNINGVYIGKVYAKMSSSARAAYGLNYDPVRTVGNFIIEDSYITGYSHHAAITTNLQISDTIYIKARNSVADTTLSIENPVNSNLFTVYFENGDNRRYIGKAFGISYQGLITYDDTQFNPSSAPTSKGTINFSNQTGTPAQGAYGNGIGFSRVGSNRRGAGIASKQITTDQKHVGLAFFVQSTGSISSDIVTEKMVLKHNGILNLASLPTSATGLVQGDLWNNAGVVNIVS